jgi:hypothetical protein
VCADLKAEFLVFTHARTIVRSRRQPGRRADPSPLETHPALHRLPEEPLAGRVCRRPVVGG